MHLCLENMHSLIRIMFKKDLILLLLTFVVKPIEWKRIVPYSDKVYLSLCLYVYII